MAKPPRYPGTDEDTAARPDREPGTPRWISVAVVAAVVLAVLVIVILHITGTLGPGSH